MTITCEPGHCHHLQSARKKQWQFRTYLYSPKCTKTMKWSTKRKYIKTSWLLISVFSLNRHVNQPSILLYLLLYCAGFLPLTSFLLCMHSSLSTTNALLNILSKQYMHFYLPTFIVTEKGRESRQTTSAAMLSWEIHIWKKCGVPEIYCCRLWNQRSSRFIFKNNTKKKQSRPVRSSSVLWLF